MEMNLEINIDDQKTLTKKIEDVFRIATEKCGIAWMNATKQILQNKDTTDTGEFINSIHYEITKNKDTYTMTGMDAVKYGVYIEKGTVKHWVPFYSRSGDPILADWGHRVLGLSEEEMKKMGGMIVSNTATHAFEKGLLHLQHTHKKIFEDTFKENMK
jgi:hypothetical protein